MVKDLKLIYFIMITVMFCTYLVLKKIEKKMNEDKFSLVMLNSNFSKEKGKLIRYLSNLSQFSKLISELRRGLIEARSKIETENQDEISICDSYLKEIDSHDMSFLFNHRLRYFELFIYYKYNADKSGFWPNKNGYEITTDELEVLTRNNKLGYIMAHRVLEDYSYFLLTKEPSDKLFFVGESGIYLLPFIIKDEPELKGLYNYLVKYDRSPFLIIIDKKLYYSLRDVHKGLKVQPYIKK